MSQREAVMKQIVALRAAAVGIVLSALASSVSWMLVDRTIQGGVSRYAGAVSRTPHARRRGVETEVENGMGIG
jgi:peptidoglycan/LPS O-acetylase OafA/YrhL